MVLPQEQVLLTLRPPVYNTPSQLFTVGIQNPMLRCLYYRIPENIFATDFAFADQKNWIKPDYQTFQEDRYFNPSSDNVFYVNTINQDVRSLVVVVRHLIDLQVNRFDNFIGTDYISNMYLKHGNEFIGPRFNTTSDFLLKYLKESFMLKTQKTEI